MFNLKRNKARVAGDIPAEDIEGKGKVLSLRALTIPIFIEFLLLMLMGNADVFMMSMYSDYAVAAIGVSNQVLHFAVVMFGVISSGSTVVQSQYMGAGKTSAIKRVISTGIITSTLIGLVISLVFVLFHVPILSGMQLYDHVRAYAHTFVMIVGGFLFFQGIISQITATLRTAGFAKDTLYITISMNLINIMLNYVAIFGLGELVPVTGVIGVATATATARGFGVLFAFIVLFKRIGNPFTRTGVVKRTIFYSRKILRIGIPGAGENMSYTGYQLVVTNMITIMGTTALTTRIYARTLNMFMFLFALSIAQASAIVAGNLMGAGKLDELYKMCLRNVKLGVLVSFSTALVFYFFSAPLLGIFTDDPDVIALGGTIFFVYLFIESGRVLNMVIINCLRASGDVKFPVQMGIVFMWGVGVFFSWFLGLHLGLGLLGVVIAQALDECIRGLVMLGRWRGKRWQRNKLV